MYDSSTSEDTATLESRGDFISIPELASVARRSSRTCPLILPAVGFSEKKKNIVVKTMNELFKKKTRIVTRTLIKIL